MNILQQIVTHKKEEVSVAKTLISENQLRNTCSNRVYRPFEANLATDTKERIAIIAEIKRSSPSKGMICADLDPAVQAAAYQKGGAAALSVLTDHHFFKGTETDLKIARAHCDLPVLRKDFIVDAYQIYETAAMGADAALLIVRILSQQQLIEYMALCRKLGLAVLVETHNAQEIEQAVLAGATIIGVNNRNLESFETNITRSAELAEKVDSNTILVAESGIRTADDVRQLAKTGIRVFLVGESLVRAEDPVKLVKELVHAAAA